MIFGKQQNHKKTSFEATHNFTIIKNINPFLKLNSEATYGNSILKQLMKTHENPYLDNNKIKRD